MSNQKSKTSRRRDKMSVENVICPRRQNPVGVACRYVTRVISLVSFPVLVLTTLFLLFLVNVQAQVKELKDLPPHPRILLMKGEEEQIKANIASDPVWAKIHRLVIDECEYLLTVPELQCMLTGRRMVPAHQAVHRIFFLSYAYRMTGKDKYRLKAEKEMLSFADCSSWNPAHFLDVAEVTMGLAIGYDWLYDTLSETTRERIRNAILTKGFDPSLNTGYAWFLTATHNWNQVCNAGITYGALAIGDEMPEFSKMLINRAISSIPLAMDEYTPDGSYPEGYGYWGYGTTYNVLFLSAIEKAFGTDFGLTGSSFLKTAEFQENMTGPTSLCFNFSDAGSGGGLSPAMFWFASKTKNLSLLWNEKTYINSEESLGKNRILPALLIWGSGIKTGDIQPPKDLVWKGQGKTPVVLMRTSWTDANAVYVGFKGGTASTNHAHMDAGTFVMDAGGVRWASDFGSENYHSLETKGIALWNSA
ncbi:hypothetical protein EZS27_007139 [termite gut metagenome]|uniref:Heparinase II N-terminal domain-containing protein n=1 Tax=termite gut metagenome TaxID=433724 RepID=A0A5J4SGM1_9ZZZZ